MGFFQKVNNFLGAPKPSEQKETPIAPSTELEHINQEIYKKSAELVERNKTLALLEEINELILSTITNLDEIAGEVTELLVKEGDFYVAAIYLYDKEKNVLRCLSLSQLEQPDSTAASAEKGKEISLNNKENFIVQAINVRKTQFANSTQNVFVESLTVKEALKSVFIAPLFVREELIGALTIAMTAEQKDISEYRFDLLNRLVGLIGIGIDNAMLYNQVRAANERLKALDKLKNEFVSVASHELRTPMTAIKSYLWMALNGKGGELNEKQKYYVERGYNSVDRLIRLVNDMLNISRIESGRITIELKSVDIIALTQEVVDEVLPRANELGVSVIIQKPESLPPVLADTDKIKEVMFNLIGNSLKFTSKGGSITISYSQSDGFIETKIADTGTGIDPEDMGKLFQKFGLLEGSYITNQTSTSMGTGLGLYICKSIINLHHGEIKAASEGRGKGSTFIFTLQKFEESDAQELKIESTNDQKEKVDLIHLQV